MFSGGIGSWAAAKRVAEQHGTDDLILLFSDTLIEDPDLYRFLKEAAANVGGQFLRIADGRDPWQVFHDVRMMGCTRADVCSRVLKREGIEPPRLYGLGFKHNNCFAGDTRFITSDGVMSLREAVGRKVEVLGRGGGWKKASVESFGVRQLWEVLLRSGSNEKRLLATGDHRWFACTGRGPEQEWQTRMLMPGERLTSTALDAKGRPTKRKKDWFVAGVQMTAAMDEVFCAVVPDGHAFALEDNILTGNCGGFCVKAGHSQFAHLLKTLPEVYRYHEQKEQEFRDFIGRGDVSILRDRRGGVTRPLTMRDLRLRLEKGALEGLDLCGFQGGCGCMLDDSDEPAEGVPG
jgi:hypothetical protein